MGEVFLFPTPPSSKKTIEEVAPRYTALFLFRNTTDPESRFHIRAMWTAYRYYLLDGPRRQPCNLPLMPPSACNPDWQQRRFENPKVAAVLRGVEGNLPEQITSSVPDAELIIIGDSPAEIFEWLTKGWIPIPEHKAPVIELARKAGTV